MNFDLLCNFPLLTLFFLVAERKLVLVEELVDHTNLNGQWKHVRVH